MGIIPQAPSEELELIDFHVISTIKPKMLNKYWTILEDMISFKIFCFLDNWAVKWQTPFSEEECGSAESSENDPLDLVILYSKSWQSSILLNG